MSGQVVQEFGGRTFACEQPLQVMAISLTERLRQCIGDHLVGCAEETLVLLVGHLIDAPSERRPARTVECAPESISVLEFYDVPSGSGEPRLEFQCPNPRNDAVERLPVEVDDPAERC